MPIDKYQPCPCGSGKKIKFCCSSDIVGELEKIQRMLDGDQRRACLEHVVHLLEKYPGRPSLLSIKARLETDLGDTAHAEETVKTLLETAPQSPVALAEQARLLAQEGKSVEAVEALQGALDAAESNFPMQVYTALGEVAAALLGDGHLVAARAHLLLHASLSGERQTRSAAVLMEMNRSPNVPLLLRQDTRFAACEEGTPLADALDAAMKPIGAARWRAALGQLESLAERHGRQACLHRNIALLRGFLARDDDAAQAWRRYAGLVEAESLDDAVEAEALAQLLDNSVASEPVDLLDVSFETADLDRLMERLLASRRTPSLSVDLASLATDDAPAPKAVFSLLVFDMPASGAELTIESVPDALCDFYVFGRETDRPPRLEMTISRPRLDDAQVALRELCGDLLVDPPQTELVDTTNALEDALTWAWRLPEDTTREVRLRLHREKQRLMMLDVWPTIPQTALDGKSPQQVQGDVKYRVRLLAAILLLELHGQQNRWSFDFNELRRKLELPSAETIDPDTVDLAKIPLVRCARLDADKLPTAKLLDFFQYAAMMHAPAALRRLGEALVERERDESQISRADVYGILARAAADNDEALTMIEKARESDVAAGQSPARWLLSELSLQIEIGNGARAQELIQRIQAKHQREPGVMQSLVDVLARYGLIDSQAPPASRRDGGAAGAPAASASDGGIWTPGSPASAPAAGAPEDSAEPAGQPAAEAESKSGLWLPGMD